MCTMPVKGDLFIVACPEATQVSSSGSCFKVKITDANFSKQLS